MDGLMGVTLGSRGMTVEAARQCVIEKKECRALVPMCIIVSCSNFWLDHCSFKLPSCALVAYHLERDGMPQWLG